MKTIIRIIGILMVMYGLFALLNLHSFLGYVDMNSVFEAFAFLLGGIVLMGGISRKRKESKKEKSGVEDIVVDAEFKRI